MAPTAVSDIFQPALIKEAQNILDTNRVREFRRAKDGTMTAFVATNVRSGHSVTIGVNGASDPGTKCVCESFNAKDSCVHVAAVLLHALAYPAPVITPPPAGISDLSRLAEHGKEPFKPNGFLPAFEIALPDLAHKNANKDLSLRPRHKLVYMIDISGNILAIGDSGWSVKAMLRPFKPDGTQGDCIKYQDDWLTEPINSTEQSALDIFKRHFFSANSFATMAQILLSEPFASMVIPSNDGSLIAVEPIPVSMMSIRFKPSSEDENERTYLPVMELSGSGGKRLIWHRNNDDHEMITTPTSILLLDTQGKLFFKLNDPLLAYLASRLTAKQHSGFKPAEIAEMRERIVRSGRKDIVMDILVKARSVIHPVPEVVVELENQAMRTCKAALVFLYEKQEFNLNDKRTPETIETTDAFVRVMRNPEYEHEAAWLFTRLLDPTAQDRNKPSDSITLYRINAMEIVVKQGQTLLDAGFKVRMKGSKTPVSGLRKTHFELAPGTDWIELKVKLINDNGEDVEANIDKALLAQNIVIAGGKFFFIEKDAAQLITQYLDRLEADGRIRIPKSDIATLASLEGYVDNGKAEINHATEMLKKLAQFKGITSVGKPASFQGDLRDYQQTGLDWLVFLREHGLNGCLADDMGLGKTIQALALLARLKESKTLGTTIIVSPVTTLGNWEREIAKFTPEITVLIHTGGTRTKKIADLKKRNVILLSYHILRNDIELIKRLDIDTMILDEAHNIKNHVTEIYKAVRSIPAVHKISLTGTPVENNILELWAQMDFLNPGLLNSRTRFLSMFRTGVETRQDAALTDKLRRTVAPFILRRKKEDVLKELPGKQEIILYSEMEPDQAEVYENHRKYYHERIEQHMESKGLQGAGMEMITGLLRLRQIALLPRLVDPKFADVSSAKFDQFKDLVEEVMEEGHKILVFSQFVEALKALGENFDAKKTAYSFLDGSMSPEKRQEQIDDFQLRGKTSLFLLSLKAGGVGINLTAADYVVLLDPWWNPAAEMQAVDRCCRIGQTKKVFAYKLITKGTVEEKVLELQTRKKQLVENLITTEKGIFKDMKKEDLLALFE